MARDRRDDLTIDALLDAPVLHAPERLFRRLYRRRVADDLTLDIFESRKRGFRLFEIKKGPLTEIEKDTIHELAESGMKSWSIARRLKIHPSTCAWYMWTQGLKTLGASKPIYRRGGKLIVPFSKEEDEFILSMRIDGHTPVAISRFHATKFPDLPHPRSRDCIASRLLMLASDETARDVA